MIWIKEPSETALLMCFFFKDSAVATDSGHILVLLDLTDTFDTMDLSLIWKSG